MELFKDNKCLYNIGLIENTPLGDGAKKTPGEPGVVVETKTNDSSFA
jgi:hypothetical protein